MFPHPFHLFGTDVSVWNVTFLAGCVLGFPVLRRALRTRGLSPRGLVGAWLVTVYVSTLGAQLFAYLFDLRTTALPPAGVSWLRYYLDPLFGAKTLYGAILFLPVTVGLVAAVWRDVGYGAALDAWTPAMFSVLAVARVGCALQGCCYGVESDAFGMAFPPGSGAQIAQRLAGRVAIDAWSHPVVPTQAIEAAALALLGLWSMRRLEAGRTGVFLPAVAAYSAVRFLLEIVRADADRNFLGPLSTSQWIAVVVLLGWAGQRWSLWNARPDSASLR